MNIPFVPRYGLEMARIGYDALTYLLTGGPTHDYDTPIASPRCSCGLTDAMGDGVLSEFVCGDLDKHSAFCTIWNDSADRLAEVEAEEEVWEPQDMQPDLLPDWDDTPEPQLTADELVAVRELIEERFPDFAGAAASLADGDVSPVNGFSSVKPSVREDKQQGPRLPAGPQHRPASVEHTPESAPDAGHPNHRRPTSELLQAGEMAIWNWQHGANPETGADYWRSLSAELRDRAEAFKAIEDTE